MSDSGTRMTGSSSSPVSTSPRRAIIPAISSLKFPFNLTKDQTEAVEAWMTNGYRGSIIYSTGTGKTEIAFQCAKRAYESIKQKGKSTNISDNSSDKYSPFNILFLVPRIILVQQNINRLTRYGIPKESIGAYFGERKEVREITVITYQSAVNNVQLIDNSNMIIFDEVHLVSDTATTLRKIFDFVNAADPKKPLLGLTATIDEQDPRYNTILSLLPPVRRYMINDAVKDRRLARPIIIPIKVDLTYDEQKMYDEYSSKIRNISRYLNTSDPKLISSHLKRRGHSARLARAWFMNVKNRKSLLNFAQNKLVAATELITKKHPSERIMVFSETIESIQKLREMLRNKGMRSEIIHAELGSKQRQKILSEWGKEFFALLSVHTLEIGYDVPDVRAAIILASTSNMNQILQRIGRAIRKTEGKDTALIYTIYLSQTHDTNTLKMVRQATDVVAKNNEKEKPANNRMLSSGNMSLDKYIV